MMVIVKQRNPLLPFLHQKVSNNATSQALCQNPLETQEEVGRTETVLGEHHVNKLLSICENIAKYFRQI